MEKLTLVGKRYLICVPILVLVLFIYNPFDAFYKKEKTTESYFAEATGIYVATDTTRINSEYFSRHKKVRCVVFQDSVNKIEKDTFIGCENLERVELPIKLEKIETYTFAGCAKLKVVVMPNELTEISENAFKGCNSLDLLEFRCKENELKLNINNYKKWGIPYSCKLRFEDEKKNITLGDYIKKTKRGNKKCNAVASSE